MTFDFFSSMDYLYSNNSGLNIFSFSWLFAFILFGLLNCRLFYRVVKVNFFSCFTFTNSWVSLLSWDRRIFVNLLAVLNFFFIQNALGLVRYSFSCSCLFFVNFILSGILWFNVFFLSCCFKMVRLSVHFIPVGVPLRLGFAVCLVEVIGYIIRLFTLALRLAVNMTTGHILMGMFRGSYAVFGFLNSLLILRVLCFFLIFDLCIGFIQSYVFSLLSSQYKEGIK